MSTRMTARSRLAALDAMSDDTGLDLLVIGGGITGVGVALDAAARGLRVGIVEAEDWSDGTSSRSSKLVHGGLRYLQMLDFALVHEALTERDLLLSELAPHLVQPVSFLFPLERKVWQRAYIGAGVALYDALASLSKRGRAMPFHRHVSHSGMRRLFPDLRPDAAVGAVRYWDAAVDDSRLVLSVLRTAVEHGALAASRTRVSQLLRDGERVIGALLEDVETGEVREVQARHVISATGVWTEETEALADAKNGLKVLASKGVHLVVPRERIRGEVGIILQTEKSVLFIIPWSRYWIIGTTDTPWAGGLRSPAASAADVEYVLERANSVLADPLTRDDIVGVFAGLRPLLQPHASDGSSSAKVSREHTVAEAAPGLTVIAGGKLTTYRVMAADAVDFALRDELGVPASTTDRLPLVGAGDLTRARGRMSELMDRYGWSRQMADHLLHRYGDLIDELVALIEAQPDLARPLRQAPAYLRAEIAYAATHEGVLHLTDVMLHRTRLAYEMADGGTGALAEITAIVAPLLDWSPSRCALEGDAYVALHEATWEAASMPDDAQAEAALRSMRVTNRARMALIR